MAAALLRYELQTVDFQKPFKVDSAGTHASQVGRKPDIRAQQVLANAQIDMGRCRARQVRSADFERFDYILAMDYDNLNWLQQRCPEDLLSRLSLLGAWTSNNGVSEIPDPYFGNLAGFEKVSLMLRGSVQGFVEHLMAQ